MTDVRPGANARQGLNRPAAAAAAVEAAGYAAGAVLGGLAAIRRGKAVHPHGIVFDAELVVDRVTPGLERAELFARPGRRSAIVRFSRSVGVPRPLPDLIGMAIRVPDAYGSDRHQDFLMVTSVDAPVAHHLFVPAHDAQQRPYSSSLPYRVGHRGCSSALCRVKTRRDRRTATSSSA